MDYALASEIGRRSVKYFPQEPCSQSTHTARQFIRGKSPRLNLPVTDNDRSQFFEDAINNGFQRFGDAKGQPKYKATDAMLMMQSFNNGSVTKIMALDQQGNGSMSREKEIDELRISFQEPSRYLQSDSQCVHPLPLSPPVANETSLWSNTSDQIALIHRPKSPFELIQTRDRREKKSKMPVCDSEKIVMSKSLEEISDISQTSNWNIVHEHPSTGNAVAGAFHSTFNYPLHSTLRDSAVTRHRSTLSNAVSSTTVDSTERNNESEIMNYVETSCKASKDCATHQLMLKKRRRNNWKFSCCCNRRSRCLYCNRNEAIYLDRVCKSGGDEASDFVSRTANRQKVLLEKIESLRSRRRRHGNIRSASDKENRLEGGGAGAGGGKRRTTTATWRRLRRQDALMPLDHRYYVDRCQKKKRKVEVKLDDRHQLSLGPLLFLTHVSKDQEYELRNYNGDRFCSITDQVMESTSLDSEVDLRDKMRIQFIADTFPRHTQETSIHLTTAEQRKTFKTQSNKDAVSNEHNFLQRPRIKDQEITRTKRNQNLIFISSQQIPSSYSNENISIEFLKGKTSTTMPTTNMKQNESSPNYATSRTISEAMKRSLPPNHKLSVAKKFLCFAKALHRCRNDTNDTI